MAASIRIGARQFGERDTDAGGYQCNQDDAIDDQNGPSRVDAGDESRRDAEPRIGEREADAQDGQDGVIPFHVLGVAHLGQLPRIVVEFLEMIEIIVGPGGADAIVVALVIPIIMTVRHVDGGGLARM